MTTATMWAKSASSNQKLKRHSMSNLDAIRKKRHNQRDNPTGDDFALRQAILRVFSLASPDWEYELELPNGERLWYKARVFPFLFDFEKWRESGLNQTDKARLTRKKKGAQDTGYTLILVKRASVYDIEVSIRHQLRRAVLT